MINIQNAVQVPFNNGDDFVTVYFDYDNPDIWYAVPKPRIARDANGRPAFTVTEYKNPDHNSSGHFNMDVEVELPKPALDAIIAAYPG
ncbi:MAG: hypothetical protein KDC44_14365, partial [Phaeodactylibacter sp.]|nr:hypothetical protein [Phaeodactylibacter sp.]